MCRFVIFACLLISWTTAQNQRNPRPFDNGHGWDIRLAVPGEPGNDYPTLNSIPRTSFTCSGKEPGYYADVETNCQVFRVCTFGATYGFQSFLCPNGTLFNQAVFVCDWWMKVNCQKSSDIFKIDNNNFSNLKIVTQFMTDVKKMITHPVRNPFDDIYKKNNQISMQEYKPPSGQLYNGVSISNTNRNPHSLYAQTRQSQNSNSLQDIYSTTDISFAASTPTSQYTPNFNTFQFRDNKNVEYAQRQTQSKPYVLPNRTKNFKTHYHLISNGHSSGLTKNNDFTLNNKNTQSLRPTQIYPRIVENVKPNTESTNTHGNKIFNSNLAQVNTNQLRKSKEFGIEFTNQRKQQKSFDSSNYSRHIFGQTGNETKQNLVSSDIPSTIITKTLAFRKIYKDSTNGTPKSRITFKTWIVRPSKNSKLLAETNPYTYQKPNYFFEKLIAENPEGKNVRIKPTKNKANIEEAYIYNAPSVFSNQVITTDTVTPNLLSDIVPSSTTSPQTLTDPSLSTLLLSTSPPEYLVPTTFKPSSLLYIPPNENQKQISRQYLLPVIENNKLVLAASSPSPFTDTNKNEPTFSVTKQTRINTNHNNLAFSDILTKEKLDITVNNIVKDTDSVLQTASPNKYYNLKQDIKSYDYPIDNYLSDSDNQSDEKLTVEPPPLLPKSSKLIATPSPNLEPPKEYFVNMNKSTNPLPNLPYYEESTRPSNTIERTVSLKITIPENIANLLFRNHNTSNYDKLELLNTDSDNYLILTNKKSEDDSNVVPMGKLVWNKNSNVSYSQDLVFSFIADSINAAREYNNIVQENILSTTQRTPTFQSMQREELEQITKDISQLTSSHFSGLKPTTNNNLAGLNNSPNTNLGSFGQHENSQLINGLTRNQPLQEPPQAQFELKTYPEPVNNIATLQTSPDKIYSGQLYQLPVPFVTNQIYNSQLPNGYKISKALPLSKHATEVYTNTDTVHDNNNQTDTDVEIIQSHTIEPNSLQPVIPNTEAQTDQGSSANAFTDTFEIPKNGITAQLNDNIVGTLPHPLDDQKLIKYKKDQTYYIYTRLNNDNEISDDGQINNIHKLIENNLANTIFAQKNKLSHPSRVESIPSLNYKLEDERDKQNILNAFQINEFGKPKQVLTNDRTNSNHRENIISTDVDYTVDHSKVSKVDRPNYLNALYDGPNSYLTPQSSVGNLLTEQNINGIPNYNLNLEKFDTDKYNNNGYPKISPVKRFLF